MSSQSFGVLTKGGLKTHGCMDLCKLYFRHVPGRRIDLLVDDAELAARRAALPLPDAAPERGYARLHHAHVLQTDGGCDLDFLTASGSAP